jgi:V8-like Glu-specific endopeptidase
MAFMTTTGCLGDAASEAELGTQKHAIIHGTVDEGDAAVLMIRTESGRACTGTLVSPRIVLTSAHCLDATAQAGVGFGIDGWSTPAQVMQQIPHPLWDGDFYAGHDVGLLVLASEITGVTPVSVSGDPNAALPGAALRIVGYGHDTAPTNTGFGVKREATVNAGSDSDDMMIQVAGDDGAQTCYGDSGGPAFYTDDEGTERLVGVASFGFANCQGGSYFTRVGAYADFLDDYVSIVAPPQTPPPPPPPDSTPPTVSLKSPTNGRSVLAGKRSIVFEAMDNVGVADVALNWSYNGKVISCSAPSAGWTCRVSGNTYTFTAEIGRGTRTFTGDAVDQAGNHRLSPRYSLRFL